jgi:gamma-glutamylcyclotransferase (GGCT)/AIG2-like uncharacterized protein YtfP
MSGIIDKIFVYGTLQRGREELLYAAAGSEI